MVTAVTADEFPRIGVAALHLALNDAGRLAPQNHRPPQRRLITRPHGGLLRVHLRRYGVIDVSKDVLVAGAIPGDEDPFRHISFPWPMAATRDASPKRSGHIRDRFGDPVQAVAGCRHPSWGDSCPSCDLAVTAALHAATPVAESGHQKGH
jgi:hypothetical protein